MENPIETPMTPVEGREAFRPEGGAEGAKARAAGPRLRALLPEIVLGALILTGVYFRFAGNNWSEGTYLNPDELGFNNLVSGIHLPSSLGEYFNTRISPLTPYQKYDEAGNRIGQGPDPGWVWGQWPSILVRAAAEGVTGLERTVLPAVNGAIAGICGGAESCPTVQFVDYTQYGWIQRLGRFLSALADTVTLLTLLAIGLRLYNRRVALLGTALSALAVTQIQYSHFMTIDNFGVLFAALAMYSAVRAAQKGGLRWYAWFGVFYGMTLGSRINFAPLGGVILLAVIIGQRERWKNAALLPKDRFLIPAAMFATAVAVTFLSFRIAQPMSFRAETGDTGFFTLSLNSEWLDRMKYAEQVSAGTGYIDGYPPAEHWANHTPILTPFLSIVLWGLGLPLGIAAFAGLIWAGYCAYRGIAWETHTLPVAFTAVMFLFLASRWVTEMRYFLVIYPFLCLLAAWAVVEFWKLAWKNRGTAKKVLAGLAAVAVVGGALVWAGKFSEIYRTQNTRLAASRWIYQNFTANFRLGMTLPGGGEYQQGVNYPYDAIGADPIELTFRPVESGTVRNISVGHMVDQFGAAGSVLHAELYTEPRGEQPLAAIDIPVPEPGADPRGESVTAAFGPVDLVKGQAYHLVVAAAHGGPLVVRGAWFVFEGWDEPLPFNLDGLDADMMFDRKDAVTMNIEWPDGGEKRQMLIDNLTRADYVIVQSQRRIWSVARMPATYPLTSEYYRALFDGRLGFDLVAVFQHPFTFGPLEISDLAGMVSWGSPPRLPIFNLNPLAAEESFSVYDHAPVWIFKKRADFSRANVESILGAVDVSIVAKQDASQSFGILNGLMLPQDRLAQQQSGGTWSDMFSYDWIWNQYPGLAVVMWWVWAVLTGWAALPLVSYVFRGLPDEGYSIAKTAGWLLVGWTTWILGSAKVPFVWLTIALVWLALLAAGGYLLWRERARWKDTFRRMWKVWLAAEILFAALFAFFLLIRLGNSDLWHPSKGGEKPMDFSQLNAVIKSTSFPPYDGWFSGGYMNYYYFGCVLIAIPIKLLGTVPTIGYNIGLAMLFAIIGATAYGVAWNLAESLRRRGTTAVSPYIAGFGAAAMLVVLGNLGEVKLVWDGLAASSSLSYPHGMLFGLGDLPHVIVGGLRLFIGQANWPYGYDTWYWNASRAIPVPIGPDGGALEAGPITEFPFFSFLYADLHAHSMALPAMILALAGSAAMIINPDRLRSWKTSVPLVAFTALAVGSMWATNSWYYPAALGVAVLGLALASWRMLQQNGEFRNWRSWVNVILLAALLIGLSIWLFEPYRQWYGAGYNAIQRWKGSKTPLDAYFIIHGIFLFILITYIALLTRDSLKAASLAEWKKFSGLGSIILLAVSLLAAAMVILGVLGYEVLVLAVPLILWAAVLGLGGKLADEHRMVLGLLAVALAITCGVELVVLEGDLDRMNTVFKFYVQAWTYFAIAAGVGLGWLVGQIGSARRTVRNVWFGALGLLAAGGLLYTLAGSYAKITDRMSSTAPRTLDGMTYMQYSRYYDGSSPELAIDMDLSEDYQAIRWMQDNVKGSPVLVEACSLEYRWCSRYIIYTGLPGVIGWNWHERQQRGAFTDQVVWDRVNAVSAFYGTDDPAEAMAFLKKYHVTYIVVGQLERAFYDPAGIEKFDRMAQAGQLKAVFTVGQTTIYEVLS
jgi:YYY domain-containing protein